MVGVEEEDDGVSSVIPDRDSVDILMLETGGILNQGALDEPSG